METARHLPAELLPEILCHLPVKSLLRFRCVSKPWLSLVDDDGSFAQLHLKTFKNNSDQTRLFTVQRKIDGKTVSEVRCSNTFEVIPKTLPTSETPRCDSMSSYSLDGLILLMFARDKKSQFCDLKVWNPSIGKLLQIPPLTLPELSSSRFLKDVDIGLGYDPATNDYKIVKLIAVNSPSSLHSVAIYPLGAGGSWRMVEIKGFDWRWDLFEIREAVYFRSSLYFIAWDRHNLWNLVSFDLSKEVFSSIILPDEIMSLRSSLVLLDAGLSLQVQVQVQDMSPDVIYVWVVDTDLMSWNKPHVYSLNFYCHSYLKKNGDMLTWRYEFKNDNYLLSDVGIYRRETKEHKTLQQERGLSTYLTFFFVESLILHQRIT